jgi:hypothetical protein
MKTIVIKNFVKWQQRDFHTSPKARQAFKQGYWNVILYTPELENYLIINEIDYVIKNY